VKPERIDGYIVGVNPGDRTDTLGRFSFSESSVDACVRGASRAKGIWGKRTLAERAGVVRSLKEGLEKRQEPIAELMTRETGKPLWECRQEVVATIRAIDLILEDGLALLAARVLDAREARSDLLPRGVVAILTPFSMPLFTPVLNSVAAMLAGNTVVFKPSKYTPGTGQAIAELWDRCRLPRGVFNLFQGSGKANGKRLVSHPSIDALLFAGSYRTALDIRQATLVRPELPTLLQCGGKGCGIVIDGCDVERAVYESVLGSFMTTGQRYNSTGRVIVTRDVFDTFCSQVQRRTELLTVGYGMDGDTFMGPMISESARKRYHRYGKLLQAKGHSALMEAESVKKSRRGYYVSPAIYWVHWENGNPFLNDEPPGPTLLIYRVDTWEDAIALHNQLQFRVSTSLFVDSEHEYLEEMKSRLSTGALNINRGTISSSMRLSAVGVGRSSNGIPGGIDLLRFLVTPRRTLMDTRAFDPSSTVPGMNWVDRTDQPTAGESTELEGVPSS